MLCTPNVIHVFFGSSIVRSFVLWIEDVCGGEQGRCYSVYAVFFVLLGHMACYNDSPRKEGPSSSAHVPRLHHDKPLGCGDHCFHFRGDRIWRAEFPNSTSSGQSHSSSKRVFGFKFDWGIVAQIEAIQVLSMGSNFLNPVTFRGIVNFRNMVPHVCHFMHFPILFRMNS